MISRILAPVDGCERSEAVLPYIEELANRLGAHVTLLHVFPPSLHQQSDAHARYVEAVSSKMREQLTRPGVDVKGIALEGKPNRVIADFAARDEIGLIAVAPHSQTSSGHWSIGKTVDKIIRETSKPVLLAGAHRHAATGGESLLSRIIVPLDGSRESRGVLTHVEALLPVDGKDIEGEVWLVHVIPADHYAAGPVIAKRVPYSREEADELQGQASRYLEEVAAKLRSKGRHVETRVEVGDAAIMIMRAAEQVEANLIAMTTHGYSGFSRLFLGSVAERVMHRATTPLLLIKPIGY